LTKRKFQVGTRRIINTDPSTTFSSDHGTASGLEGGGVAAGGDDKNADQSIDFACVATPLQA
jgi:hypothetical protein